MKEGWEYKKLGEVCRIERGGSPRPIKDFITNSPDGLNWIKIGDTDPQGKYIYSTKEKIKPEGLRKSRWVEVDEFLLSNSMSFGRPYILKTNGCIHDGWLVLRDYQNSLIIDYFYYLLISPHVQNQFRTKAQGSTVSNLNTDRVADVNIAFPPLSEQQSIVDYLDSAFAKIDAMKANAEKALNEAKALFQASLKEMLEPKEGWEEKKLEDITEVKDGTHDSPKYVTEGIPFVTQKNITISGFDLLNTKKISLEDHKKFYTRSNVEFGDIIIAMIGANRGMSCIVDTREIFSIKNVGLIKKNDNINMRYLLFYLHSPSANTYILNNSNGGAQEFIGLKGLRTFPIPYPPLSEQQSIVATLDSLKSKVDHLKANYDKISQECDALKQAILRQVFE